MSTSPKLITVFGATGQQGGSVARSLLRNPDFRVRGITRNPSTERAKALQDLGIEVVAANGFDGESMKKAFEGSWGAFINTNSDDPEITEPTKEIDLGKTILDAAAAAGVQHVIFSGSIDPAAYTNGEVSIPMFTAKDQIERYARSLPFKTAGFVYAGWFFENFLSKDIAMFGGGFPLVEDEEGFLSIKFPKWGKESPQFIAMQDDFGDIVHGMFLEPEAWNGKVVQGFSHQHSYEDLAKIYSEITGKRARYIEIPHEEVNTYGVPALEGIKLMFRYCELLDGRYYGEPADLEPARKLKKAVADRFGGESELMDWGKFVRKYLAEK